MKKIIAVALILFFCWGCFHNHVKSDIKLLNDFANQIVDKSISIDSIVESSVKYTKKGKQTSLYVLNTIRQQYKKKDEIVVYSAEEYQNDKNNNEIKLKNNERLYYIKFNKEIILPFIVNDESKIIVLLVLTKGKGGTLSDSRSDE
ncbi:hypothetical protein [Flavobacterium poyangense]|uniref:hypothetical protein n=1 Tax=Flavobacterium poyangense TaxID=2204302 RepID=UPI00141F4663|nr:hypothetical protein [Flavobacterium sp. JXAS1]